MAHQTKPLHRKGFFFARIGAGWAEIGRTGYNTGYVKVAGERKRREKGEGALHFRKDKGLWQYEAELSRGADGKRRRRVIYARTEKELKRKIADAKARGGGVLQPVVMTRISEYVEPWLQRAEKRLKPLTAASYRWAWNHASPLIGGLRLDRFDRAHVLALFDDMERAGASANTVRHVARVMQTAIEDAIAEGVFTGLNPFKLAAKQKPKHRVEKGRALTVEEARQFIEAAREDELEAAWILGLTGGLRIGEMFGLKWSDVDLQAGLASIQRQAVYVDGELRVEDLKTEDSLRVIALEGIALEALQRRRDRAQTEDVWVFPGSGDMPMNPQNARRHNFAKTKERAKLSGNLTPHDLRHSMNSFGHAAGVPEKVMSARMGHANSQITREVYTHSIDADTRDAAIRIDTLLRGPERASRTLSGASEV